jgi:hypothetical protein
MPPEGIAVFWPAAGISSGVLIALGPGARWPVAAGGDGCDHCRQSLGEGGHLDDLRPTAGITPIIRPALSINLEAAVGILGRKLEAGVSAAEPGALGSEPLEAAISGDSLPFLT